jgi:hypothetical protein
MEIMLESGITVFVKQIPNVLIFETLAKLKIPVPQPPIVELDDGRETENTFSPVYQDAITIYQLQMNNLAFDAILSNMRLNLIKGILKIAFGRKEKDI